MQCTVGRNSHCQDRVLVACRQPSLFDYIAMALHAHTCPFDDSGLLSMCKMHWKVCF